MANTSALIDGILCKRLRPAIDSALTEIGERFGVVLEAGNASYEHNGKAGHFKLLMRAVDVSGDPINKEAEDFKTYAHVFGLSPEDLGREVTIQGVKHTISGLLVKARKNNILVTTLAGKVFTTTDAVVRRQLQASAV